MELNVHGFYLSKQKKNYEQKKSSKTTRFQLIFAIHFYDNSINNLIRIDSNRVLNGWLQPRRYTLIFKRSTFHCCLQINNGFHKPFRFNGYPGLNIINTCCSLTEIQTKTTM